MNLEITNPRLQTRLENLLSLVCKGVLMLIPVLILLTIVGSRFLWERRRPDRSFWFWAQWVVLIVVAGGIFGRLWLPDLNGVTQRVAYFGIYLWMLVIVREIGRQRRELAEMNLKNVGETPTLFEGSKNEI